MASGQLSIPVSLGANLAGQAIGQLSAAAFAGSNFDDTWELIPTAPTSPLWGQGGTLRLAIVANYSYAASESGDADSYEDLGFDIFDQGGGTLTSIRSGTGQPSISGSGSTVFLSTNQISFTFGSPFHVTGGIAAEIHAEANNEVPVDGATMVQGQFSVTADVAHFADVQDANGNPIPLGNIEAFEVSDSGVAEYGITETPEPASVSMIIFASAITLLRRRLRTE